MVIVERTQIIPNLESKVRISKKYNNRPAVLFAVDFFDPWYWRRLFLDDRKNFLHQHELYRAHGKQCQGISFFANDTFGHFVTEKPLSGRSRPCKTRIRVSQDRGTVIPPAQNKNPFSPSQ